MFRNSNRQYTVYVQTTKKKISLVKKNYDKPVKKNKDKPVNINWSLEQKQRFSNKNRPSNVSSLFSNASILLNEILAKNGGNCLYNNQTIDSKENFDKRLNEATMNQEEEQIPDDFVNIRKAGLDKKLIEDKENEDKIIDIINIKKQEKKDKESLKLSTGIIRT